jgi:hypothetical protein
MNLPESLTKPTKFSKFLALFLFILFPLIGFYVGLKYQESITPVCDCDSAKEEVKKQTSQDEIENPEFVIDVSFKKIKKLVTFLFNKPPLEENISIFATKNFCTGTESSADEFLNSCFEYDLKEDIYFIKSPSSQVALKIIDSKELSLLEEGETSNDGVTEMTRFCKKEPRLIANLDFIALNCIETYKYYDGEKGELISGISGDKTSCLYKIMEDKYLVYETTYESIGSKSDNCQYLEDLGLYDLKIRILD